MESQYTPPTPMQQETRQLIKKLLENMGLRFTERVDVSLTPQAIMLDKHFYNGQKLTLRGVKFKGASISSPELENTATEIAIEFIQSLWKNSYDTAAKEATPPSVLDTDLPRVANILADARSTLLVNTPEIDPERVQQAFHDKLKKYVLLSKDKKEFHDIFLAAAMLQATAEEALVRSSGGLNEYVPKGLHPKMRVRLLVQHKTPKIQMYNFMPEKEIDDSRYEVFAHHPYEWALKRKEVGATVEYDSGARWKLPPIEATMVSTGDEAYFKGNRVAVPKKQPTFNTVTLTFDAPRDVLQFTTEFNRAYEQAKGHYKWPDKEGIHYIDYDGLEALPPAPPEIVETEVSSVAYDPTLTNLRPLHDSDLQRDHAKKALKRKEEAQSPLKR